MATEIIQGQTEELLQGIFFLVEIDGARIGFEECSGLSVEAEIAEYREGTDLSLYKRKVAGLLSADDIELKRATTQNMVLNKWWDAISIVGKNAPSREQQRRNVAIHVLDQQQTIKATWHVSRALPKKFEWQDLQAMSSEILIETFTITHEGIKRAAAGSSWSIGSAIKV